MNRETEEKENVRGIHIIRLQMTCKSSFKLFVSFTISPAALPRYVVILI